MRAKSHGADSSVRRGVSHHTNGRSDFSQKQIIRAVLLRFLMACVALSLLSVAVFKPAAADDEQRIKQIQRSVVVIGGYSSKKQKFIAMGSGFVVANDYVVTNHHVTNFFTSKNYKIYAIKAHSTRRVAGRVLWADKDHDVALIHAPNLGATPIRISTANPYVSQKVGLMGFPGLAATADASNPTYTEGALTKIYQQSSGGYSIQRLQYDAFSSGGSSGGAVIDMCGRAMGYHNSGRSKGAAKINQGFAIKHAVEQIRRRSPSVPLSVTSAKCIIKNSSDAAAAAAQQEAKNASEKAAKVAKELKDKLLAAEKKAAAEKVIADKRILDMQARDDKQNRMLMGVLMTVVGLAVLTLVLLVLFVKKPRQAFVRSMSRMVGASAPAPAPQRPRKSRGADATEVQRSAHNGQRAGDRERRQQRATPVRDGIVLSGFDENGNTIRLAIGENDARGYRGITFGRSSDFSDRTLSNSSVSKRQFRLTMKDGTFFIQDLNSTNGTSLNGRFLAPYSPERLSIGSTLSVGDLQLTVSKR